MNEDILSSLQEQVRDGSGFQRLDDYVAICLAFLSYINEVLPTRIISPSQPHYIFYQYSEEYRHKITRPLNTNLFIESPSFFKDAFERFASFLSDLKRYQGTITDQEHSKHYIDAKEINKVVYTVQQAIGSISDSFENPNQSRKRVGQLFENLIKLIIQEIGVVCEPRTINIPIPGYPDHIMSYQLDLVFSHDKAIVTSETNFIHTSEIVGSVKTTSKDRIDKIFLDKYLLTKLLGRDIPVVAIFLHDVQRAVKGNNIFGVHSTFKSNHFLGYTVALNRLDGVYYVDPRPEMTTNERLRQQIFDFQQFLVRDIWTFSTRS
jgi:hypothetical protein